MTTEQHRTLMKALDRIAKALEAMAFPYTVTFEQPAPSQPAPSQPVPHVPNPYWNPPTYQPIRFDYYTGDPLPPDRPENIC